MDLPADEPAPLDANDWRLQLVPNLLETGADDVEHEALPRVAASLAQL